MSNNSNNSVVMVNSDSADNTDNVDFTPIPVDLDNLDMDDKTAVSVVVAQIVTNALNGDATAYTAANVSIKANVRKALETGKDAAIRAMDLEGANAHINALSVCKGAKATKATETVDHAQIVANRAFTLIFAGIALIRGEVVPNGINPEDVDFSDNADVQDMLDVLRDVNLPDVSDFRDIAGQKVTKSDIRVDIGAHIAKVIEGAEVGTFFSVRKIASTSTEVAPNGCPSDGAVAMRLFPQKGDCTLIGTLPIKPVTEPVRGLIVTE